MNYDTTEVIFTFIPICDLFQYRPVCKLWNQVAIDMVAKHKRTFGRISLRTDISPKNIIAWMNNPNNV